MSVYLHDIPLKQAKAVFQEALEAAGLWGVLETEEIPLDEQAVGRVVAEPIWAKISSPHYHASAMDGFAVRAHETEGALMTAPLTLRYGDQTQYVDTGDPLPEWANAVIMIEQTEPVTADGVLDANAREPFAIRIREAVPPWKNVRPLGEDMVATQLVIAAGHTLRPVDLGAIAGCGHYTVRVARRPKVAILPTGTELKPVGVPVQAGDIIEYNSLVLAAQVNGWGGAATRYPIAIDVFEEIQTQVREAAEDHDLILLNAGSSAGSEDFSARVVESLGDLLVHGVAVRPGHPVILGMVERGRRSGGVEERRSGGEKEKGEQSEIPNPKSKIPIIGVPGYPVSAALTGEIFVEPLLAQWLGRRPEQPLEIEAQLTRKHVSPLGDDEYARMAVGKVGERVLAAPLSRGAGVITSLVRADGIAIFPEGSQGQAAGSAVKVRLYRSPAEIERTILAIGSHDMTLDLLAQFLVEHDRRLASANVGSLAGLVSLRRGEAHLGGSHLLDPETGEYNISYIQQRLPDVPVTLVTLVGREQGLLLPAGNPKGIGSLADLARPDVQFVNRQRGAGTRVLLDYELGKLGVDTAAIQGYEQEEYTHLAVAAAVKSGRADVGLGIAAAAQALGLAFRPLFQERYDLVVPTEFYESELLRPLWEVIRGEAFRAAVGRLPGYEVRGMGEVVGVFG